MLIKAQEATTLHHPMQRVAVFGFLLQPVRYASHQPEAGLRHVAHVVILRIVKIIHAHMQIDVPKCIVELQVEYRKSRIGMQSRISASLKPAVVPHPLLEPETPCGRKIPAHRVL